MKTNYITSSNLKGTHHGFFTKSGGISHGIYSSLNCGYGSNDNKNNILSNRKIVSKIVGIDIKKLVIGNQTHSNKVVIINKKNYKNPIGDALITTSSEYALGVLTADCAPILIFSNLKNIVGVIHAGWKGVYSGIIENFVKVFLSFGDIPENLKICVGPTIGQKSYEVGIDLFEKFYELDKRYENYFIKSKVKDKFFLNLAGLIKNKFIKLGAKEVVIINEDTFKNNNLYFSHRYNKLNGINDYGRMISVIKLKN